MQQQHLLLACTPAAGPLLLVPRPRLLLLAVVFATAFFGGAALTPALTGRAAPANAMTSLEMMRHGNVSLSLRFLEESLAECGQGVAVTRSGARFGVMSVAYGAVVLESKIW